MSKEADRAALESMLAASKIAVTKVEAKPMDASLSASFVKLGIDKKQQTVKKPRSKPVKRNWEAQRRYDEAHGTVNGYDPIIESWNEFHRNEMGE